MSSTDQASFAALFQAGWFVESLWTQTMVIHMLRTPGIPLLHSRAAWQVTLLTGDRRLARATGPQCAIEVITTDR